MQGYVKLHRKLLNSTVWQSERLLRVFMWCLLKASHKPRQAVVGYQVVALDKGEFVTGSDKAAAELGLTRSAYRRAITGLQKLEMIATKPASKYTVITVINWELYQCSDQETGQQSDQETASNPTSKRPASGQQAATDKNGKNGEECLKNGYKNDNPPKGNDNGKPKKPKVDVNKPYSESFLKFWKAYPKKTGKGEAWKSWQKINGVESETILDALEKQKLLKFDKIDPKYIPLPATWLNQKRWEDEAEDPKPQDSRGGNEYELYK